MKNFENAKKAAICYQADVDEYLLWHDNTLECNALCQSMETFLILEE